MLSRGGRRCAARGRPSPTQCYRPVVTRVLILGGTGDARRLADLATAAGFEVVSSLAGRTTRPALPGGGEVRIGGFGGVEGLATYLRDERIEVLVDATHPFADEISSNAAQAAASADVPRVQLVRPAWAPMPGDRWLSAPGVEAAAAALPGLARRVFLTIGRQELAAFGHLDETWFLYRMIEAPEASAMPAYGELILDRGPFTEASERALMLTHGIEALVTRNSGGAETFAKIEAARALDLRVVMIERPSTPPGEQVDTPEAALAWLMRHADIITA